MSIAGDVLVVEDDSAIRMMLVDFLTEEGYAIRSADGIHAALTALAERLPALVLLDKCLPPNARQCLHGWLNTPQAFPWY